MTIGAIRAFRRLPNGIQWGLRIALLSAIAASLICGSHTQQPTIPPTVWPEFMPTQQPAKPTPVFLGRDMTPTTEHVKPKVVPPVVKVTIPAPKSPAPATAKPVKLGEPVRDGARW